MNYYLHANGKNDFIISIKEELSLIITKIKSNSKLNSSEKNNALKKAQTTFEEEKKKSIYKLF